jgi:cardiolipin synthase
MTRGFVLFALCAAISACASVPDVNGVIDQPSASAASPEIIGAHGPLTAKQSKALFARMGPDEHDTDALQRHLLIEQAVAESPLVAGNHTHVLRDGVETFRAVFSAIRAAKDHVNLEYFIFEDIESDGQSLGDLLIEKQRAGVLVNIIYDSFGSSSTPSDFFNRLKEAGVTLVQFNPVNPLSAGISYAPNDRDHRKILVVDGATAIVGGVNLSAAYQSSALGKSSAPEGNFVGKWRDTDLEITGPVVAQLQKLFLDHWAAQKGPELRAANFFPMVPPKGTEVVRIIGSTPDNEIPRYYVTLLSAIRNAEKSVWLIAAYFVPTDQEKEDLISAARRGIDVRILVPDQSDSESSIAVQHSQYSALLKAGVKIYESHNEVLHSKTVVVDGVWSVIGSSNFDHRSVIFNDEVDAVVLGADTAQELGDMFEDDLRKAAEVELATWKKRPFSQKINEMLSRLWQSML